MYMAQASEANAAIKSLNSQTYMARYIRNYLTSETNRFQLLPANSGIDNANIDSQITEYNNQLLEQKLDERLSMAGIEVVEARINYLAYAPEIAAVMLRRQQASAIISAREKIVEGAESCIREIEG